MPKQLVIYLPSVILLIVALLLTEMGREVIGKMNGRELALFLAFWWTVLAAGFHLVRWIVRGNRRAVDQRGFEIIAKTSGDSARK